MKKKIQKERATAVRRYLAGEAPGSICASLGKTTRWLYKWVSRHTHDDPAWCEEHSRRPLSSPYRTPAEIEEIVEMVRLNLYNKGLFCGNQAIQWEMNDMEVKPIPSLSTIGRILCRRELTHRRTGRYEPKGKKYPELPAMKPNQTHQLDLVGPCYLTGPTRFYSLHVIDPAINRCGIEPIPSRAAQNVLNAVYAIWQRMGIPENLQVDNEPAFFGSPAHPRSMGPLIRLCLHYGVNLWFIPPSEPWWNGVVEKFNDHYRQKFLGKITMTSMTELRHESLTFEHRHNSTYRYSKIKGKTPLKALARIENKLVFPSKTDVPRHPLKKPEEGRYHFVRFIRSNCRLNIFGEMFPVPPETQYEYVVATIDVKEQKLKLFLGKAQNIITDCDEPQSFGHGIMILLRFRAFTERCRDHYFCERCPERYQGFDIHQISKHGLLYMLALQMTFKQCAGILEVLFGVGLGGGDAVKRFVEDTDDALLFREGRLEEIL